MRPVLVFAILFLAGCTAPPAMEPSATLTPTTTTGTPSPSSSSVPDPVLFLLVENKYHINRTSGSGSAFANVGGHCDDADYTLNPPTLDLTYRGDSMPGASPHAALVRH